MRAGAAYAGHCMQGACKFAVAPNNSWGSKGGGRVGKKRLFWGTATARLYHMMWEDRKKGADLIMVKTSDRTMTTCEKRMRHPGWKMYCFTRVNQVQRCWDFFLNQWFLVNEEFAIRFGERFGMNL